MNGETAKLTRDFLLRALARYPRGISEPVLGIVANGAGVAFEPDGPDSLAANLQYLADLNFVARAPMAHTPSAVLWRITARGDDYLREAGLI